MSNNKDKPPKKHSKLRVGFLLGILVVVSVTITGFFSSSPSPQLSTKDGELPHSLPSLSIRQCFNNNTVETVENEPVTIDLRTFNPNSHELNFTIFPPRHGNLSGIHQSDETLTYTPNFGFNGTDRFRYIVSDNTSDSEIAYICIEVLPKGS